MFRFLCFFTCLVPTFLNGYLLPEERPLKAIQQHVSITRKNANIPSSSQEEVWETHEDFKALVYPSKENVYYRSFFQWDFYVQLLELSQTTHVDGEETFNFNTSTVDQSHPNFYHIEFLLENPIPIVVNSRTSSCEDWELDDLIYLDLDWDFYISTTVYNHLFFSLYNLAEFKLVPGKTYTITKRKPGGRFNLLGSSFGDFYEWNFYIHSIVEDVVHFTFERVDGNPFAQTDEDYIYLHGSGSFHVKNPMLCHIHSFEKPSGEGTFVEFKVSSHLMD